MSQLLTTLLLFCLLPSVDPLFCYTCVFPAISPLDCLKFPTRCPPGQLCLSSKSVGKRGDFQVILYEKSCVLPVFCGITGEKFAMGVNFTFTNDCCNTQLCNGVSTNSAFFGPSTLLSVLMIFLYLQ
ncbi:sperm acrosome membrane-associated protein 4-like [Myxocyprinus asiaticus]|uniref:sperm acrosome membrane-associated protein 4-like n=1 Tax=Myxocyprinus asiaticus TaxID=70543 RepID=UPI0022238BF5|nr:sperm acrosome membrane-associated protein 4-like [Myxocyprinus asiaticus]